MLSDFDEGKRSCRFKLERHNNRRRRKVQESGEDGATPGGGSDKASLNSGSCYSLVCLLISCAIVVVLVACDEFWLPTRAHSGQLGPHS